MFSGTEGVLREATGLRTGRSKTLVIGPPKQAQEGSAKIGRNTSCSTAVTSLGGHPKPAIEGHFKTGQR